MNSILGPGSSLRLIQLIIKGCFNLARFVFGKSTSQVKLEIKGLKFQINEIRLTSFLRRQPKLVTFDHVSF